MAPRHGITVYPGTAIDFSALARPASQASNLLARATKTRTGTNAVGIIVICVLVLLVVGIIFSAVVLCIIMKNKRARRKRQQHMDKTQTAVKHEYRALEDQEPSRGIQELPPDNQVADTVPLQRVELQSDVNEIPKVSQLKGYAAPPMHNNQPIELPSDTATKDTFR